jgi:uncharacterized protein YndB with AHSA1/START domain
MAKKVRSATGKAKGTRGEKGTGRTARPASAARGKAKSKIKAAERTATRATKSAAKVSKSVTAKGASGGTTKAAAAKKSLKNAAAAVTDQVGSVGAAQGRRKGARRSEGPTAKPAAGTSLKVAGISNAAVHQATGKGWTEWLSILDRAGAADRDHRGIVALVAEHGVGDWWSQQVAVGYEQARGKREPNQASDGFQVSVSKTIAAPAPRLFAAFMEPTLRDRWLSGSPIEVRSSKDDRSVRATWTTPGHDEGTSVEATFDPRDGGRTMVRIDHRRLADAEAVKRSRVYWASRLENLRAILERPVSS